MIPPGAPARGAGLFLLVGALSAGAAVLIQAPTPTPGPSPPPMSVEEYDPKSTLVVPRHEVPRAKYPFIDIHSHQDTDLLPAEVDRLVREMDTLNLRTLVNLSGGSGEELTRGIRNFEGRHPGRFAAFANTDLSGVGQPGWGERAATQLEADVRAGARGLKIYKDLGLTRKDAAGGRIPVDDPRLEPLWRKCGELGIPVLIHTGEPAPFFAPHDRFNERWLELRQFPQRARPADRFPPWEQVMDEQRRLFARHPKTRFIAAHLAWLGGDLARLGAMLDALPNVSTEIGAVLAELGRQPRFAREWFIRYQDRVLFGKDAWAPEEYPVYFRVLETADEYFDYYRKRHAFWKMYGLALPDGVLRKLYFANALRLIPGLDASAFPR